MKSSIDRQIELSNRFKNALEECGVNINKNYFCKIYENQIEMVLTEKDTFKRVFGGTIDLRLEKNPFVKDSLEKLTFSVGSMGSFDTNCEASTAKHLTLASFINSYSIVSALVTQFCESVKNFNKTLNN